MNSKNDFKRALSLLASLDISSGEKLRRLDRLLDSIPQTQWDEMFSILSDEKRLRFNLLNVKDLLIILLRYKDYKGLHQLKQRIYLIYKKLPNIFNINWRRYPLGRVIKDKRIINRAKINPLPEEFYLEIGELVKNKGISVYEKQGTEIIRRGENYNNLFKETLKKMGFYPNIRSYLFRESRTIINLNNVFVKKEVQRFEEKSKPLYLKFNEIGTSHDIALAIVKYKNIDRELLEEALKISQFCARSEEEGKPLNLGMIIGDQKKVFDMLKKPLLEVISKGLLLRVSEWPQIREKISRKVNGKVSSLIIDGDNGEISDARFMGQTTLSEITSLTDTVAFMIKESCVNIFFNGEIQFQLILNRKYGQWSIRNLGQIRNELKEISFEKSIDYFTLNKILEIARIASENKEASLFVIGNYSEIKENLNSDSLQRIINIKPIAISDINKNELLAYSREDGAIVIDEKGNLRGTEVYFTKGGGRHDVARYVTEECPNCVSIVVSRDTTISIYDSGQLRERII